MHLSSAGVPPAFFAQAGAEELIVAPNHSEVVQNKTGIPTKKEQRMGDELSELQENAEHGREDNSLAPVSVTMAIIAVLVAVVSLMGHRSHTEEVLMQARATDQWSYYQAKNIRRHNYEMAVDLLALGEFRDKAAADKVLGKYKEGAARENKEQAEIEEQAKDLEKESAGASRKADRFDLGEVFLEIALVISSLALLTRNRNFWYIGIVSAIAGVAVAVTGLLLH
jgi:Domain of unknown function (DUF4337)